MTARSSKTGIHLDSIVAPKNVDDEAIRRARLKVAHHSLGVEDCALLLDMLGLNLEIDK